MHQNTSQNASKWSINLFEQSFKAPQLINHPKFLVLSLIRKVIPLNINSTFFLKIAKMCLWPTTYARTYQLKVSQQHTITISLGYIMIYRLSHNYQYNLKYSKKPWWPNFFCANCILLFAKWCGPLKTKAVSTTEGSKLVSPVAHNSLDNT